MKPFLQPTSNPSVFDLQIDHSSLEHFNTCARSAEYYIVRRRELAEKRSALDFGTAIHLALEHRYNNCGSQISPEVVEDSIAIAKRFLNVTSPASHDDWRNADQVEATLRSYFSARAHEPFDVLFVEKPFSLPLVTLDVNQETTIPLPDLPIGTHISSINIYWTGKIDLAVRTPLNTIAIVDHKTTSMLGPTYWDSFNISQQMFGYCWAASEILNLPVTQLILNVLATRKPSRTGRNIDIERNNYHYSPSQISEGVQDIKDLVSDFISHFFSGRFPRQSAWCVGKYGRCPYFDVCCLPNPQQQLLMLSTSAYKDVTWSPLNETK